MTHPTLADKVGSAKRFEERTVRLAIWRIVRLRRRTGWLRDVKTSTLIAERLS
jgi:hypothetical protein